VADPTESAEPTYSLGAVVRLTGLSAHVLRAWERRYEAVRPLRTPGGTRRYREADVARLRSLRKAVASGHPIGEIARLSEAELEHRLRLAPGLSKPDLAPILAAIERMHGCEAERLLGAQLAALGGVRFARLVASPLLAEVGDRWENGRLCVASEHLVSTLLRNLLGGALRTTSAAAQAPAIVFTTAPGERHELGALMAAVAAADAGGNPVFFGPDLPIADVARAVDSLAATAVALGICRSNGVDHEGSLRALRAALPDAVEIWVGGAGAASLALPPGAAYVADADELERKVALRLLRPP
jgi:DNA-binding transcriptional MerR regulator